MTGRQERIGSEQIWQPSWMIRKVSGPQLNSFQDLNKKWTFSEPAAPPSSYRPVSPEVHNSHTRNAHHWIGKNTLVTRGQVRYRGIRAVYRESPVCPAPCCYPGRLPRSYAVVLRPPAITAGLGNNVAFWITRDASPPIASRAVSSKGGRTLSLSIEGTAARG